MQVVQAAGPVNGRRLRKTVKEREAVDQESQDITRNGEAGNRNLEPTEGRNYPNGAKPNERTNAQVKKSKIDASFNMTGREFINRTHA